MIRFVEGAARCFVCFSLLALVSPSFEFVISAATPSLSALPRRRVLVADDARVMRALVQTWLTGLGFDVTLAKDGVAALSYAHNKEFDLVLLDINMPGLTGLTVLDSIRHNSRTEKLPVVLLTTLGHAADFDRGRALGATAYLTKPLSLGRLITTLNRVLPPRAPLSHPSHGSSANRD